MSGTPGPRPPLAMLALVVTSCLLHTPAAPAAVPFPKDLEPISVVSGQRKDARSGLICMPADIPLSVLFEM